VKAWGKDSLLRSPGGTAPELEASGRELNRASRAPSVTRPANKLQPAAPGPMLSNRAAAPGGLQLRENDRQHLSGPSKQKRWSRLCTTL